MYCLWSKLCYGKTFRERGHDYKVGAKRGEGALTSEIVSLYQPIAYAVRMKTKIQKNNNHNENDNEISFI